MRDEGGREGGRGKLLCMLYTAAAFVLVRDKCAKLNSSTQAASVKSTAIHTATGDSFSPVVSSHTFVSGEGKSSGQSPLQTFIHHE